MSQSLTTSEHLALLFEKEQWTEEDKSWVLQYLESTDNSELRSLMEEKFNRDAAINISDSKAERILLSIHEKIDPVNPKAGLFSIKNWKRLAIAASVLLIAGTVGMLFFNSKDKSYIPVASVQTPVLKNDIAPGHDNAILTLANGSVIVLDSIGNGELAEEGNAKVMKTNGQIVYTGNGPASDKIIYHTMSTARGNQYHLLLADGSRVWLNAASSIKFPTTFTNNERRVEITGEVYFEVAHDATKPFFVDIKSGSGSNGGEVQVLGTHFNINAYDDEVAIKTTLAEGKVKVNQNESMVILRPSQQAMLNKADQQLKVQQANLEKELAWRTSMFEFQDDDLPTIMRQLSRWYDVDIKFSGPVSKKIFNGSIRRQASLSQVLQILKLAGVTYTLEEKTVIVKSN